MSDSEEYLDRIADEEALTAHLAPVDDYEIERF